MQLSALPNISRAKLPAVYEQARTALETYTQIDECAKWANKAEAIASYAKQADDDSMRRMADRIQARAIRRCGELLREIAPSKGGRPTEKLVGAPTPVSRTQAAKHAGLSRNQKVQALRVANVPQADFESAVESERPPTIGALAERGTQRKVLMDLQGRDPEAFKRATGAHGALRRLAEMAANLTPEQVVAGTLPHEHPRLREHAGRCAQWLLSLDQQLGG